MEEEYLTVSQAAARLGVSERTIQRRCKSGKLAAQLVTTDDGQEWQIETAKLPPRAAIGAANVTTVPGELETEPEYSQVPPSVVSVPPGDDTSILKLLAEKDARIEDLRSQVDAWRLQTEAANRTAAETAAALREALKAMPKAITEGAALSENFPKVEKSTQEAPPPQQTAPMDQTTAPIKPSGSGQSKARRLKPWQVVIMRIIGARD